MTNTRYYVVVMCAIIPTMEVTGHNLIFVHLSFNT